jgi:hypothetical protein
MYLGGCSAAPGSDTIPIPEVSVIAQIVTTSTPKRSQNSAG